MAASLAPTLYAAHRSALSDPTSVPAWGNASTEEREAWEAVARKANELLLDRCSSCGKLTRASTPPELRCVCAGDDQCSCCGHDRDEHVVGVGCECCACATFRGDARDSVTLVFATEPAASTPDLHGDIVDPAAARRTAEEFGGFGWAVPYRGPTTCYSQPPCGRCTTCALQAARDNAARDQPPAFTGTMEQLKAVLDNPLDRAARAARVARVLNDRSGFHVDDLDDETRTDLLDAITKAVLG